MYNLADLKERRANEKKIVCVCVCVCVCFLPLFCCIMSPPAATPSKCRTLESGFFLFFFLKCALFLPLSLCVCVCVCV